MYEPFPVREASVERFTELGHEYAVECVFVNPNNGDYALLGRCDTAPSDSRYAVRPTGAPMSLHATVASALAMAQRSY